MLSNWGEHGLRFHKKFPWTHTMHLSFHEMGYILPALNRMVRNNPEDKEAEERAAGLVRGMRSLVISREVKTFWSGDSLEPAPVYEFPNDVYLQDGGFDLTRHTGRGEHVRLYQRDNKITKYYPLPSDIVYSGPSNKGPTQQTTIVDKK